MHERRFNPSLADRLDSPERQKFLPADEVIDRLQLREGDVVADIGAGTGYFTLPMAARVGRRGSVLAVDVSPEMLDRLRARLEQAEVHNVQSAKGEASATGLADRSCDVVFLANVWHEFDDHDAVLAEVRRLLRPEGRVAILDWRPDVEPDHGPPPAHRIGAANAGKALEAAGFTVGPASNVGHYAWMLVGNRAQGRNPSR
ncbi:MAG: class I SAM-dependent methyltransferase [Acidobacteriota bacterium]